MEIGRWLGRVRPSKFGASAIGRVGLRARQAHPLAMSSLFPNGNFPFHTDTAHWVRPARYLILFCGLLPAKIRPTRLLDSWSFIEDLARVLSCGVWRTRVHPRFYTLVLSQGQQGRIVRWDQGILEPCNEAARNGREAMIDFLDTPPCAETFDWRPNAILIIDNWRMLHTRGHEPMPTDPERALGRLLVT